MRSILRALSIVTIVGCVGTALMSAQGPSRGNGDEQMSDRARQQIQALMQEKATRSHGRKKMDSQLVYGIKMHRGEKIAEGVDTLLVGFPRTADGDVIVDITANVDAGFLGKLRQAGATVLISHPRYHSVRAQVPLDALDTIADFPEVRFIQPMQEAITTQMAAAEGGDQAVDPERLRTTNLGFEERERFISEAMAGALEEFQTSAYSVGLAGVRKSEADVTHRAAIARNTYGADGTGIKIGVLSDGVRNLAAAQASGDIGPVTVLPGQSGTAPGQCPTTVSCDEGTAMLELIHDIAPGAQLFFATALGGPANFAVNIGALRKAGCDIIVDDVFYLGESPFQDGQAQSIISPTSGGVIMQAVNDVTADGALYFSSAGNSGNKNDNTSGVWEGDFVDGGDVTGPLVGLGRAHQFPGGATFNALTAIGTGHYILNWSDPLGGSANDYDLYLLNAAGTLVLAQSTNEQSGTQDPFEGFSVNPNNVPANARLVIVRFSGADRYLRLTTNRGRLNVNTPGQTSGHSAALNAFSVAATPAAAALGAAPNPIGPFPNPFTAVNNVELFSSDGPRKMFFTANGTLFTPGVLTSAGGISRQKPDITAADGASVTGAGGFGPTFFGTSAAAPHAAAIAALLKSANPALTPAMVRDALQNTAIDNEGPGVDRDSGNGIIMADTALQSIGASPTAANVTVGALTVSDAFGNGNGFLEPGERGTLSVPLLNTGVAAATAVSATLSTTTPGVAITPSATRNYPDIAATNGASTGSPFEFVLLESAPYAANINFVVDVTYNNGSTRSFPLLVPTGRLANIASVLDANAPVVPPDADYAAATGLQLSRMNFTFPISGCGAAKANPGVFTSGLNRRYDAYTFTNTSASPICVTVNLTHSATAALYVDAYIPTFVPTAVSTNFAGDNGGSSTLGAGTTQLFSFTVPASSTFVVVVSESNSGGATNVAYNLRVSGLPAAAVPANLAPVNSVPVGQSVVEDGTLVFSSDAMNALSIADADAGNNPVQVTLTAAGGVLSLGSTAGLAFSAGDGSSDPTMTFTGSIASINSALDGTTFAPADDFNGAASIALTTSDLGLTGTGGAQSDSDTVPISVIAVNDAPSFTAGANQSVAEDSGPATVPNWATGITAGPDESSQALSFVATNDNEALFSVQPAVAPNGTLTFTPAADANGVATVTLSLRDDGGVDHSGVDTSAPLTFTITVGATNDAPVLAAVGNRTVVLGSTLSFSATATDIDLPAQGLTFSLTGTVPAGASIDPSTGQFTWTPSGPQGGAIYTIGVRVTDGGTLVDEEQITIAVVLTATDVTAPVENGGVYHLGRVLPIKFSLTGASAGLQITARLLIAPIVGGVVGPEEDAQSSGAANDDGLFRQNLGNGQYMFNWSTKGYAPGTYRLRIDLGDGVLRAMVITLR